MNKYFVSISLSLLVQDDKTIFEYLFVKKISILKSFLENKVFFSVLVVSMTDGRKKSN